MIHFTHFQTFPKIPEKVQKSQSRAVAQPEWGRRGHGTPWNKLAKIFTGDLYQFSMVRKTSVTDDVIDWPLPNTILDCGTDWDKIPKSERTVNVLSRERCVTSEKTTTHYYKTAVLWHNPRGVTREGKGGAIPWAPNHYGGGELLRGAPKSPNNVTSRPTFFNSGFASERPQVRTWGRHTCFLPRVPSRAGLTIGQTGQMPGASRCWGPRAWISKHSFTGFEIFLSCSPRVKIVL